jgi:energy-coupling factor transporter ATP-binding protein EcfA2
MIEVSNLEKSYDEVKALSGVSFAVKSGEIIGLLGPNGAGKTTIMKILAGFLHPSAGTARVGGYDVLGENLSYCAGTGCADDPSITDGSGMGDGEGWWAERDDYTWADDSSTGTTSHYTQVVSSNVYAIGCATQLCNAPGPFGWDGDWWWAICQYGPRGQGYWSGTKPYEAGNGGLIEPPAAVFDDHPGLCGP